MAYPETQDGGWGERLAGGLLDTGEEVLKRAGDRMLGAAPKVTRYVLKSIPYAPGFVYGATKFLTSDQPLRAAAGLGGGLAGGEAGGLLGAAAGGVNAPIGAVLGASAGADVATDAYDRYYADHKAQLDATNQWIVKRRKQLLGR